MLLGDDFEQPSSNNSVSNRVAPELRKHLNRIVLSLSGLDGDQEGRPKGREFIHDKSNTHLRENHDRIYTQRPGPNDLGNRKSLSPGRDSETISGRTDRDNTPGGRLTRNTSATSKNSASHNFLDVAEVGSRKKRALTELHAKNSSAEKDDSVRDTGFPESSFLQRGCKCPDCLTNSCPCLCGGGGKLNLRCESGLFECESEQICDQ